MKRTFFALHINLLRLHTKFCCIHKNSQVRPDEKVIGLRTRPQCTIHEAIFPTLSTAAISHQYSKDGHHSVLGHQETARTRDPAG